MEVQIEKEIIPTPSRELIEKEEKMWGINLPAPYKDMLMKTNGGSPVKKEFIVKGRMRMITTFLCVLEDTEHSTNGCYDIDVVLTQIEDRLTDNEDLVGCELLPIAELFAGDYLCLDYRADKNTPSVCVWSHEESGELAPVTYQVARSFDEFAMMLQ